MTKQSTTKKAAIKKSVKKAAVKKTAQKAASVDPALKILQTTKCRTISDKSELTYNIAMDGKGSTLIRINNNTGGGYWSHEWVSFDRILMTLREVPEDRPVTSIHLFKLFEGKSSNTPGFLLAVLLKENLLAPFQGKKRQYAFRDDGVTKFQAKVDKLKTD